MREAVFEAFGRWGNNINFFLQWLLDPCAQAALLRAIALMRKACIEEESISTGRTAARSLGTLGVQINLSAREARRDSTFEDVWGILKQSSLSAQAALRDVLRERSAESLSAF